MSQLAQSIRENSIARRAAVACPNPEAVIERLYTEHADRLFAYCRRRLRSRQEAEDALQTTFLRALPALRRGVVPVCELAWLFKIAERVCIIAYRTGARRNECQLTPDAIPAGHDSGSRYSLAELRGAISGLPDNQRRAFLLREFRGLSYEEIAMELGASPSSVDALIRRARQGLALALTDATPLRQVTPVAGARSGSVSAPRRISA